jgi:hypothetical protein
LQLALQQQVGESFLLERSNQDVVYLTIQNRSHPYQFQSDLRQIQESCKHSYHQKNVRTLLCKHRELGWRMLRHLQLDLQHALELQLARAPRQLPRS